MKGLSKDIEACLCEILDLKYVGSVIATRLKSGARVYRMTGAQEFKYHPETDTFTTSKYIDGKYQDVPFTDAGLVADQHIGKWEMQVLKRGRDKVRDELEAALIRKGHAVAVRIGGHDWYYPASIAVEQLSKPAKAGDSFNSKVLAGELIAIGETLDPLRKTIDEISVRLRALGIAITMKGGGQ